MAEKKSSKLLMVNVVTACGEWIFKIQAPLESYMIEESGESQKEGNLWCSKIRLESLTIETKEVL